VEHFAGVEANQLVTIREGQGISRSLLPAAVRSKPTA
jgi:hypothetical protein